jgi:hypothetical protein
LRRIGNPAENVDMIPIDLGGDQGSRRICGKEQLSAQTYYVGGAGDRTRLQARRSHPDPKRGGKFSRVSFNLSDIDPVQGWLRLAAVARAWTVALGATPPRPWRSDQGPGDFAGGLRQRR